MEQSATLAIALCVTLMMKTYGATAKALFDHAGGVAWDASVLCNVGLTEATSTQNSDDLVTPV
jgi:hypothetical protein